MNPVIIPRNIAKQGEIDGKHKPAMRDSRPFQSRRPARPPPEAFSPCAMPDYLNAATSPTNQMIITMQTIKSSEICRRSFQRVSAHLHSILACALRHVSAEVAMRMQGSSDSFAAFSSREGTDARNA